ncbi:helix-turn-helix domain-containing protein [Hahella sp. CR1]|uniref:helix-turn-helix domain-containing protein n=1 Tax=Hahella sp. CR1 TaxID=2992807 RepID=UPI0024422341|nr:helix-turn-helix transcriptional regulator [Hahella sp. CR1]MDG9669585.1 helix-turn-helix domain-containing protein [Hahella sp. CR1]
MSTNAEKFLVEFGQKMRDLRKQKGLTQEDVAKACGFKRPYLSDIERGKRNISARSLVMLASFLGAKLHFSLELDRPKKASRQT